MARTTERRADGDDGAHPLRVLEREVDRDAAAARQAADMGAVDLEVIQEQPQVVVVRERRLRGDIERPKPRAS